MNTERGRWHGAVARKAVAAVFYLGSMIAAIAPLWAQVVPPTDPCGTVPTASVYLEVQPGTNVNVCWNYPIEAFSRLRYFRVRTAQAMAGNYFEWFRVTPAQAADHYWFEFPAERSLHLFMTAVWNETQPDGTVVTRESPGSGHIQIRVTATPAARDMLPPPDITEENP